MADQGKSRPGPREVAEVCGLANQVIEVLDRCEHPLSIIRALELVTATFCDNAPTKDDALLISRGIAKHVELLIVQGGRAKQTMGTMQ
jgi:hypothetical protein